MQSKCFRPVSMLLVLALFLLGTALPALAQQASQSLFPTPEAATAAALEAFNLQHNQALEIAQFRQAGRFAYSSAAAGEEYIVLLSAAKPGQGWTALAPNAGQSADYNSLLAQFPDELIDESTRALLYQPETSAVNNGAVSLANYTGHKLPWAPGLVAYVTQKDGTYHMNQIDFDIRGLAASGEVYASRPGQVVFVKESSNTTCQTPAPDPCWKKSNMVVVQHGGSEYTWYVHLAYNSVPVSVGQNVGFGTKIGVEGETGYSFGIHLHYMASTGHTPWTDPNNPNDAPWATGTTAVDFVEAAWADMIEYHTYTSQNWGNTPPVCPAIGGLLLYREVQYGCGGLGENSGYLLRTGSGFQNLPVFLNDAASSVFLPAGWSARLYQNTDRGGGKTCINAPGDNSFSGDTFDNGAALNDQVSSVVVFPTLDCTETPVYDTSLPGGDFTGPVSGQLAGRTVQLSAAASDGQSGIGEVRFAARWGGGWHRIATDTSAPYEYLWDLCATGVPDGDIELAVEIVDGAGNVFAPAGQRPNPLIRKAYDCSPLSGTWNAAYWANPNLSGEPGWQTTENGIYLFRDWADGGPDGGIPPDGWSARFVQTHSFPGGEYRFHCQSSDGCRIWIDGQERISAWTDADFAGHDWTGTLTPGSHEIKVEYYDNTGPAQLEAWWQGPGYLDRDEACETGQWCAEYWGNPNLAGTPALLRNEGETHQHVWGNAGPDPTFPVDYFSGRATRRAAFTCGTYRFHATASAGLRLWVAGELRLDQWSSLGDNFTTDINLSTDTYTVKIEHNQPGGDAAVDFWWEKISDCPVTLDPVAGSSHIVRPGTVVEPSVRVQVSGGYLDPARGDQLVFLNGNALGAGTPQPVRQFVSPGSSYTFDSNNNNSFHMTAPATDGQYSSQWQVRVGSSPVGSPAAIHVTVDSTVPQISLPISGTYLTSSTINLQANVTDTLSGVSHVQFFAGYNPGSGWGWFSMGYDLDGSNGWSKTWDASQVPDQTKVSFFAFAWDRAGNGNGDDSPEFILDRTPPVTSVQPLAGTQDSTRFLVQWATSDNLSGLSSVNLEVQTDGGAWQPWLNNVNSQTRQAWFTGQMGHSYGFRMRGIDLAGNAEGLPAAAETSTSINLCSGDIYEADGSAGSATALVVDDLPQPHNLCGSGDYDWVSFQAVAGTDYILHTLILGGTTDTVLTFFAADGATQLGENDNIDTSHPGSFILWRAQSDGVLYGRVRHADGQVAGNAVTYSIQVTTVSKFFLPVVQR